MQVQSGSGIKGGLPLAVTVDLVDVWKKSKIRLNILKMSCLGNM